MHYRRGQKLVLSHTILRYKSWQTNNKNMLLANSWENYFVLPLLKISGNCLECLFAVQWGNVAAVLRAGREAFGKRLDNHCNLYFTLFTNSSERLT